MWWFISSLSYFASGEKSNSQNNLAITVYRAKAAEKVTLSKILAFGSILVFGFGMKISSY